MSKLRIVDLDTYKQLVKATDNPEQATEGVAVCKLYNVECKAADDGEREIDLTISSGEVDRDDDTLNPAGWKLSPYRKNPVVLWAHSRRVPPIARAKKTWLEDSKLRSVWKFLPEDLADHDHVRFADMIYEMYRQKFLRAASVGFKPLKWAWNEDRNMGIDFESQELLEVSGVPVGSNRESLAGAKSAGIDLDPYVWWVEEEQKAGRIGDDVVALIKGAAADGIVTVGGGELDIDDDGAITLSSQDDDPEQTASHEGGGVQGGSDGDKGAEDSTPAEPEAPAEPSSDEPAPEPAPAEPTPEPTPAPEPEPPAEPAPAAELDANELLLKSIGEQVATAIAGAIAPLVERIESLEQRSVATAPEPEETPADAAGDDEIDLENLSEDVAAKMVAVAADELNAQFRRRAGQLED